jgi:hypothetical protein
MFNFYQKETIFCVKTNIFEILFLKFNIEFEIDWTKQ